MTGQLIEQLQEVLTPDGLLIGEEVAARLSSPTSGRSSARYLARPRNTEEVSAVLRLCHAARQPVVPLGGMTGLVGGGAARESDLVLSLERLNRIEEVDEAGRTMTVQAGVPIQAVQERAEEAGLLFPLDLGARGSATVGGTMATNAGGNRVIRYGMMRELVLGVEAVLADGTVISSLNKMLKNNTGYDLKQLFIGSEGTLGVITRAVLRLKPQTLSVNTAFVAVSDFAKLAALLRLVDRGLGGTLSAFEVMWPEFYRLVCKNPPPLPFDFPYYVLLEALGSHQQRDAEIFETVLGEGLETGLIADAVLAQAKGMHRDALWAMRDDVDALVALKPIVGFDVSLGIPQMEGYVAEIREKLTAARPEHRLFVYGHLGDGNLHVTVAVGSAEKAVRRQVEEIVYGALRDRGGSVSAEHGIGLHKRPYLSITRSEEELNLMRTLKKALDPRMILNPGKILKIEE